MFMMISGKKDTERSGLMFDECNPTTAQPSNDHRWDHRFELHSELFGDLPVYEAPISA